VALFRRILVALSGGETDRGLLCYAAMLRRTLGDAEYRCVHIARDPDSELLRTQCARRVSTALPGVECDLLAGDLLDCILETATEYRADLILLGHASQRRRRSLARRLSASAPCSVWMAPEGSRPEIRKILIPVDFSRRSADTVAAACVLAEASGLDEALALHVHFNDAAVSFDEFDEMLAEDQDRAFALFVAPIDLRGVWVKPLFLEAPRVADAIIRAAGEYACDLIVMGTRGRSPSAAVLLGSETEQCIMTTGIPLLAVKHFGARLSLLGAMRDERVRRRADARFT
jgi:nucleotide-binding universal stress UspA family protein